MLFPHKNNNYVSHNRVVTPQLAINYTTIRNMSPALWNVFLALGVFITDHTLNISM